MLLTLALPLIPVSLGVAILRYRLYELDLFVNRALVYTLLSAAIVAIYLGVVTLATRLADAGHSLEVQAVATLIAAAAFQPLRSRAQQLVDGLFYGDRARPYEVLARLGEQLELAPLPDAVLQTITDTVADALRLPGASIEVREGEAWVVAARRGTMSADAPSFEMVYQGQVVGRLLAAPRAPGENFTAPDLRLLSALARHAGVATHAARVNADLQRSRAALITAREEERRRLRRDLHDGLGPTLAGATLSIHAARASLRREPERADGLLGGLEDQITDAIQDIRRLVYGLRPPALDEVGLVRALQQHATRLEGGSGGLTVVIEASPSELPQLPAAVEVAAYRIATEAMANTSRHAGANLCRVQLTLNGALRLDVTDDGRGFDASATPGVGLSSMRERAAELGGSVEINESPAGTHVIALLPFSAPHA